MKYLLINHYKHTQVFLKNAEELKNALKELFITTSAIKEAQDNNAIVILDLETQVRVYAKAELDIILQYIPDE